MYDVTVLPMAPDFEGAVVATLISRRADSYPAATDRTASAQETAADRRGARRAVLYLHGFTDYFFQDHLADHYLAQGVDFYALDLRKYGRSLLPHQTRGLIRSVTDYFPEIDEAVRIIREDHDELSINAHSTGGLIAALWADRVRGRGLVQGLVLNSPFFELNVPTPMRLAADVLRGPLSRTARPLPVGVSTAYGESLHRDHGGEWEYNLEWKPLGGFPVHGMWLAAIRRAHHRLHHGLAVDVPVLVLTSDKGARLRGYAPEARSADIVLDPAQIARWATSVGSHVTCVRIPDGLHDLILSAEPVRKLVFDEIDRWSRAYLEPGKP